MLDNRNISAAILFESVLWTVWRWKEMSEVLCYNSYRISIFPVTLWEFTIWQWNVCVALKLYKAHFLDDVRHYLTPFVDLSGSVLGSVEIARKNYRNRTKFKCANYLNKLLYKILQLSVIFVVRQNVSVCHLSWAHHFHIAIDTIEFFSALNWIRLILFTYFFWYVSIKWSPMNFSPRCRPELSSRKKNMETFLIL